MRTSGKATSEGHSGVLHPLCGSNLSTLARAFSRYPRCEPEFLLRRLFALGSVLARFPFYTAERIALGRRLRSVEFESPPVFIVGHWRSGSTHLHNLLVQDPGVGTINFLQTALPWDFLNQVKLSRRIIQRSLPENRLMDNVGLTLDSAQEEEMALGNMNPMCYYYCYYFPQHFLEIYRQSILFEGVSDKEQERLAKAYRYLLRKLTLAEENHGKRLVLKNPASSGRMRWLKGIFPGARFVHIVRNPYSVFASTLKHFRTAFPSFALQSYDEVDCEDLTLEMYRLLMGRYLEERIQMQPEDLCEVTFEAVVEDPVATVGRIYEQLQLPGCSEALRAVESYAQGLKNYRRNTYNLTPTQIARIQSEWGFALEAFGYDSSPSQSEPGGVAEAD